MYINKWVVLSAAAFTQLSAGLPYCFSVYSEALKDRFGYNQTELQTVGFACSLGAYLGVISGLFYDSLRKYDKLGPRLTLLVGMTVNLLGFLGLWASGAGYLNPSLWGVAFFAWVAHNNGTWFDTASMVTIVRNFPNHRGTVVGAMKSITGISGAVYVQVYLGFFSPDAIQFILFLAIMPFIISCVTILFLNHVPFVTTSEGKAGQRLLFMYGVIIILAMYVTFTALWQGIMDVPQTIRRLITFGIGILLLPLLTLPIGTGGMRAKPLDPSDPLAPHQADQEADLCPGSPASGGGAEEPLLITPPKHRYEDDVYSPTDSLRVRSNTSTAPSTPRSGFRSRSESHGDLTGLNNSTSEANLMAISEHDDEGVELPEYTLIGAVMTMDFWLLGLSAALGMGSGLVLNNNLAQVVQALGGAKDGQGVHVSLFAVANCFGRLLAGYLPQYALNNLGIERPWFLAALGLLTSCAALLNAYVDLNWLMAGTILTGVSFGCHWTLLATLTSEVFGLKYFATIYKLLSLAPSIGGYLLATILAGHIYDDHTAPTDKKCSGQECFRSTFLICGGLALVEAVCGLILVVRTRHIYRRLIEAYRGH